MSLINDALKRAKAVQEQTPPPPAVHLPLRPADPQVAVLHGVGLALPIGLAVVALLILFFAWRFYQDRGPAARTGIVAAANSGPTSSPVPAAEPSPAETPAAAKAPPLVQEPAKVAPPVRTNTPTSEATPEPAKTATAPEVKTTNATAAVESPAPTLPPLKLQGVVFSRTRPSAVISGKTVFVGDRIREFRVVAISSDTAVLTSAAQTNVLSLSD